MTKKDLIIRISRDTGMSIEQCEKMLDSMIQQVEDACASGESVLVQGFGKFSLAKVAKDSGRYRVKFSYARRKTLTPSDTVDYNALKNMFK